MDLTSLQSLKAQLQQELERAQSQASNRTPAAVARYQNTLHELDRVEHLLRRYSAESAPGHAAL